MEIIARKIGPHESFPNVGYIEPLFKLNNKGAIVRLEEHELDHRIEVHQYNEINSYFQKGALFKILINQDVSDKSGNKFIADGQNAIRLLDNVAHLILAELPDRNDKEIILSTENFPGTKIIFLVNGKGECFGPLEWEVKNKDSKIITVKKITAQLENFKLPEEFINKIDLKDILEFAVYNGEKNVYLVNQLAELGIFVQGLKEYFDYSSDQEIISFFTKKLTKRNTPINEITPQHLANSVSKHLYTKELIQYKIDLLKEISVEEDHNFENIFHNFENFFLTDKGKLVLENYVKINKNEFEKIINFEKDNEYNEQLKEKENRLKNIQERIDQARSELLAQQSVKPDENVSSFDSALMQELEDLRLKNDTDKNLQHMKWLRDQLKDEIEELKDKKTDATVQFSKISDDIKVLMNDARSSALEFKVFWDLYSKKEITPQCYENLSCIVSNEISTKIHENLLEAQEACIDLLHYKMTKDGGYFISKMMLANFMLATQQTFITFLAGSPGVGKTSLVKYFCEKQNIANRLLNVAVSRGWTSQRDLIGFYNPLNENFQVSNSGVFNFIKSILNEKVENNQPTAYVLLDEANLSPIEHYWSSFMGQSDYKSKEINLGSQTMSIPDNIRFVGTINYDETTEKLSPRILNRATIINLDNSRHEEISNIAENLKDLYPLSYKDAESLFGRTQAPSLKALEEEALKKVVNILELKKHDLGRPIIVSYRKKEAIQQYCHKGRNLLEMYTDNPLTALDLAIKQNLLPLISGYGYGLQKRLTELLEILDQLNLEYSKSYLKDMIEYGNIEMNTYDFFNI